MSGPLDFSGDEPSGPERDAPAPAPERSEPPAPARPSGTSRYSWFVGVVAVLLLAVVTLNTVGSEGPGAGPARGDGLVAFAVPLAAAPPRPAEDANLGADACRVRGAGILNLCLLVRRGPVVLALFPAGAAPCREVLAQIERVRPQVPGVRFIAVGSAGDRRLLTTRPWSFPVGWDKDRAVASVYGLVGCPQLTFARRGGRVAETTRGAVDDRDVVRRARRLLRPAPPPARP